ncbi:restriction endonuclease (plasmid) [Leuconostoc mesenteroides]|nr:restriction endonuclease [Leuconostoc mesenteroides]
MHYVFQLMNYFQRSVTIIVNRNADLVTNVKKSLRIKLSPLTNDSTQLIGFTNRRGDIFPFGTDSKIIGRLFEILSKAMIEEVADEMNLKVHESEQQNSYPDFWLSDEKNPDRDRIAIDIKSTYRKFTKNSEVKKFNFTLGSYASFIRNGTKNINGNYSMYSGHLIIGFLYTRNLVATNKVTSFNNVSNFIAPFNDIEVFVSEKHMIASDKPGSGNTENIATIKSNKISDFENEIGPFSIMGEEVFEDYWINHPRYLQQPKNYTNLPDYISWKKRSDSRLGLHLENLYNKWNLR